MLVTTSFRVFGQTANREVTTMELFATIFGLITTVLLVIIFYQWFTDRKKAQTNEQKKSAHKEFLSSLLLVLIIGGLLTGLPLFSVLKRNAANQASKEAIRKNCQLLRIDDGGNWDGTRAVYQCPNGEVIQSVSFAERNELIQQITENK